MSNKIIKQKIQAKNEKKKQNKKYTLFLNMHAMVYRV